MNEKKIKLKTKVLYLTGALLLTVLAFNNCTKDDQVSSHGSTNPYGVMPADKSTMEPLSSATLKWPADPRADTYNIYFGEKPDPELYKTGYTSMTLNAPIADGRTYYWRIGTVRNGDETLSPVYSFKVKVLLDINKFTGLFECDEPRYTRYEVSASRLAGDTLAIQNFWDINWTLKHVFDDLGNVKVIPTTFNPDPSLAYMVSGSGTFDNQKNEFRVKYTITQKVAGAAESFLTDQNTHTFVKK